MPSTTRAAVGGSRTTARSLSTTTANAAVTKQRHQHHQVSCHDVNNDRCHPSRAALFVRQQTRLCFRP
jgi:hypothetical protein